MRVIGTIGIALCAAACAQDAALGAPGDAVGDGAPGEPVGCLASSECPPGSTCDEFHVCDDMAPPGDGGGPAETEIALGPPTSSQRFVHVAMTEQGKLARIDGATLTVATTPVGPAPRAVSTIPGSDGAVALDAIGGTATVVRPTQTGGDGTRVLATLPSPQPEAAVGAGPRSPGRSARPGRAGEDRGRQGGARRRVGARARHGADRPRRRAHRARRGRPRHHGDRAAARHRQSSTATTSRRRAIT